MIKFGFIGGTIRGLKLIEALLDYGYLPTFAVILKEDDHEHEKHSIKITTILNERGIANSIKKKLNASDYELIKSSALDLMIVSGWRTLIRTDVNEYLKYGMIAAHQSLLPKYRGFAPTQWAIINGEKETGVTLFRIEEGEVDSGMVFSQRTVEISDEDYGFDLDQKFARITIEMYLELFESVKAGSVEFMKQNEDDATYACKRVPQDGRVDWNRTSVEVYNLIRALAYPYSGAFCFLGERCFIIRRVTYGKNNHKKYVGNIPGRVIGIFPEGIEVLCGKGSVLLTQWEEKGIGIVRCPSDDVKSINTTLM